MEEPPLKQFGKRNGRKMHEDRKGQSEAELTIVIKLEHPIEDHVGGDIIHELRLREPVAKDLRKLPTDPKMDDILKLVGRLSNLPDSVIDKLKMKDVSKVADELGNFM